MFPFIPSNLQQLQSDLTTSSYFSEATQNYAKIAAVFLQFLVQSQFYFLFITTLKRKLDLRNQIFLLMSIPIHLQIL